MIQLDNHSLFRVTPNYVKNHPVFNGVFNDFKKVIPKKGRLIKLLGENLVLFFFIPISNVYIQLSLNKCTSFQFITRDQEVKMRSIMVPFYTEKFNGRLVSYVDQLSFYINEISKLVVWCQGISKTDIIDLKRSYIYYFRVVFKDPYCVHVKFYFIWLLKSIFFYILKIKFYTVGPFNWVNTRVTHKFFEISIGTKEFKEFKHFIKWASPMLKSRCYSKNKGVLALSIRYDWSISAYVSKIKQFDPHRDITSLSWSISSKGSFLAPKKLFRKHSYANCIWFYNYSSKYIIKFPNAYFIFGTLEVVQFVPAVFIKHAFVYCIDGLPK